MKLEWNVCLSVKTPISTVLGTSTTSSTLQSGRDISLDDQPALLSVMKAVAFFTKKVQETVY